MTKQELSAKLKTAVSSNQFDDGRQIFQELLSQYPETIEGWDVFNALKIQRAGVNIEDVEQVAEKFLDFGPVKNMYVLVLKEKYIDTLDQNNFRNHEPWIEKITQISEQKNFNAEDADPYPCNYTKGVLKLLKLYRKPNLNVEKVTYWIAKLDPAKLSREENKFKDSEGKDRVLASPQEDYYSMLSDLKLKERKFEECIEICDYALGQFTRFHYDNDIWFKRRKALSLIGLGNQDDGFEILLNLSSNRKGEKWFIFHEIAKIYLEKGEYTDSLVYCVKAIALPRDEDKKINLYADTARCLFKLNRLEDARVLADFIAAVTAKENLKQKSDILRIFEYFKIKPEDISDPKSAFFATRKKVLDMFGVGQKEDFKKRGLESRRSDRNNSHDRNEGKLFQGRVVKLLHDNEKGKVGFLKSENEQHYFSVPSSFHLTQEIIVGTNVEFKILTNEIGKKERVRIMKIIKKDFN